MNRPYEGIRILLVHAHPDDETINNGATMALYADRGAQVTLVTCTRGEEGEVLVPGLSHLASTEQDLLGSHRETELALAMKALGISDYRFLGAPSRKFRDSGMMGTEANNRPDVFWQADLDTAAKILVEVIEEVKPHILITYDEIGGYGTLTTFMHTELQCSPLNYQHGKFKRFIGTQSLNLSSPRAWKT